MVNLVNRHSVLFDYEETKRIFDEYKEYLNCPFTYSEMIKSDWFFGVLDDKGITVGICYILMDNYKNRKVPFYSGAFERKKHKEVKEAHSILVDLTLKHYKEVYTWTPHLHGHVFNRKVGMEYLGDNIFYKKRSDK